MCSSNLNRELLEVKENMFRFREIEMRLNASKQGPNINSVHMGQFGNMIGHLRKTESNIFQESQPNKFHNRSSQGFDSNPRSSGKFSFLENGNFELSPDVLNHFHEAAQAPIDLTARLAYERRKGGDRGLKEEEHGDHGTRFSETSTYRDLQF